jgi:hypothetical protein
MAQEFDIAVQQTDDQLWLALGRIIATESQGFGHESRERLVTLARLWFEERRSAMQAALCSQPAFDRLSGLANGDPIIAASAIADLIESICGRVPVSVVSVLVLRTGLATFCTDFHER